MRILITGYPRTGKTTLALEMTDALIPVRHTDATIPLGWSEGSAEVARWLSEPGPWIIEGVSIPRALRKWLAANEGAPCDRVHFLTHCHEALSKGQRSMAKGIDTVWREIVPKLRARGVAVVMGCGVGA